jgi:hypothetical protein
LAKKRDDKPKAATPDIFGENDASKPKKKTTTKKKADKPSIFD